MPTRPEFTFFTPIQPEDIYDPANFPDATDVSRKVAVRLRDVIHEVYHSLEASALPAPNAMTSQQATTDLLRSIPTADMRFDTELPDGAVINSLSSFTVRFASVEEWGRPTKGEKQLEPLMTFQTKLGVAIPGSDVTPTPQVSSAIQSFWYIDRPVGPGHQPHESYTSSLMGVRGKRRSLFRARYTYDTEQREDIRTRIAKALIQSGQPSITEAQVTIRAPRDLIQFEYVTPISYRRDREPFGIRTAERAPDPELSVPALRILRRLVMIQEIDAVSRNT